MHDFTKETIEGLVSKGYTDKLMEVTEDIELEYRRIAHDYARNSILYTVRSVPIDWVAPMRKDVTSYFEERGFHAISHEQPGINGVNFGLCKKVLFYISTTPIDDEDILSNTDITKQNEKMDAVFGEY